MKCQVMLLRMLVSLGTVGLLFLGGCGGGTSRSLNNQPPPPTFSTISSLSPSSTQVGGPAFTLSVLGSNFVSSSVVRWNGSDLPTTFDNSGQLSAQVSASDIAAVGTAVITVFNPTPSGDASNAVAFTINSGTSNGTNPSAVAVAPDPTGKFGKFVYVTNFDSNNVSMYSIDAVTGALEAECDTEVEILLGG